MYGILVQMLKRHLGNESDLILQFHIAYLLFQLMQNISSTNDYENGIFNILHSLYNLFRTALYIDACTL